MGRDVFVQMTMFFGLDGISFWTDKFFGGLECVAPTEIVVLDASVLLQGLSKTKDFSMTSSGILERFWSVSPSESQKLNSASVSGTTVSSSFNSVAFSLVVASTAHVSGKQVSGTFSKDAVDESLELELIFEGRTCIGCCSADSWKNKKMFKVKKTHKNLLILWLLMIW